MSETETHDQEEQHEPTPDEAEPVTHEPTPDEADEHEADEDEQQPEAVAPKSEKEIEKALKAVERAGTTYRNAVSRAMGEDAQQLVPCPRCNAPAAGLIFDPKLVAVDDDTREATLASLGLGAENEPPLREAEGVEMCPRCDGHGQLKYPTRNVHVQTQMCPRCGGQGYVNKDEPQQQPVIQFPTPQTAPNTIAAWTPDAMPDSWGRPVGHPHYGQTPASINT